ncbi:MAG: efflux RND transporter periplasmic adaptor subunit [Terriglobales bacterium]|jgi:multidrug resistance efflux pump
MSGRVKFLILLVVVGLGATAYYFAGVDRSGDLVLIGTVDANQVIVSSQIQGRIQKLLVDEGTQVHQGDLIAELDPVELEAEKHAAEATQASLESQLSASRYTERVTRGSTSSDVTNAQARLQAARSSLAEAQANLALTQLDTDRTVKLAADGVASEQDRDRAQAALTAQKAHVQALQDQVRSAEADVTAAEARLHQTNAAESTVAAMHAQMLTAQAQQAEAETRLGYTRIYAPVSGLVSVRAAREGEVVNPGTPIVTIVDLGYTWAYAAVPETYSDRIRLGDQLNVRMPGGHVVSGEVIFKAAEGDFATQRDVGRRKRDIKTVGLKVRLDNSQRNLVPGMTAEVLIPKSVLEGKSFAPSAAGNNTLPVAPQPSADPPPAGGK